MNDYRALLTQAFNIASLQNGSKFESETEKDIQLRAEVEFANLMKEKANGSR